MRLKTNQHFHLLKHNVCPSLAWQWKGLFIYKINHKDLNILRHWNITKPNQKAELINVKPNFLDFPFWPTTTSGYSMFIFYLQHDHATMFVYSGYLAYFKRDVYFILKSKMILEEKSADKKSWWNWMEGVIKNEERSCQKRFSRNLCAWLDIVNTQVSFVCLWNHMLGLYD